MLSRNLIILAKYNLFTISTTTYMRTRKLMQGLNGVPSKPFTCLVALVRRTSFDGCGGHGKRGHDNSGVHGSLSPRPRNAGTWLHPPAPFQTGRNQFREERTDWTTPATLNRVPSNKISSTWPVVPNSSTKSSFAVDHGSRRYI